MAIDLPIPAERVPSVGLFRKLLGLGSGGNAFARAKNAVLSGRFTREDIDAIDEGYSGDLRTDFAAQWADLLEDILYYAHLDARVDADEAAFIKQYTGVFAVPRETAQRALRRAVNRAFTTIATERLRAGAGEDDASALRELARSLGLDPSEQAETMQRVIRERIAECVEAILADGRVSDTEWEALERLALRLGEPVRLSPEQRGDIEIARARWHVEFGALEFAEPPPVPLQRGERLAFLGQATWLETRKDRGETCWKEIRRGDALLTTTRLLFIASEGDNKSLRWDKVLGVREHGPSRFEIERPRGKSPVIDVVAASFGHRRLATLLAGRLFADAHKGHR